MSRRRLAVALIASTLLAGGAGLAGAASAGRIARTFERYRQNVVPVRYELRLAEAPEGGKGGSVEGIACGVVVGPDGLVVTTGDPFPDLDGDPRQTLIPEAFRIIDSDGREHAARAVGLDRDLNLAFLRLERPGELAVKPVEFASRSPRPGEEVLLIGLLGEPYGYAATFTLSYIVSEVQRPHPLFVVDALIQDLTIGGLVVSSRGEPLGLIGEDILINPPSNQSDMASSGNVLSLFAALSQGRRPGYPMVFPYRGLLDDRLSEPPPLDSTRWTNRGWLGIIMQPLSEELASYWNVPASGGVVIGAVIEGSPAERAGLEVGDVILEVDSRPVRVREQRDLAGFRELVQAVGAGREVPVDIFRDGARTQLSLTLGNRPKTVFLAEEREDDSFGLTVKELTFDFLQALNLPSSTRGVFISEIENAGWADVAGLAVNDVIQRINGIPVESLEAFDDVMAEVNRDRPGEVLFFVRRGTRTLFVAVKTSW